MAQGLLGPPAWQQMRYNERYAEVAAFRPCPVVSFRLAGLERRNFCLRRRRQHGHTRTPTEWRYTKPAPERTRSLTERTCSFTQRTCPLAERTCPVAVAERTADSHGVV